MLRKKSYIDGSDMTLVFSDEFNQDGRTFYPGDDPFWEAVDLQYWATVSSLSLYIVCLLNNCFDKNDLEWYDPQQGISPKIYC